MSGSRSFCNNRSSQNKKGEDMSELIRINKYLSEAGVCSRREADRHIEAGRITINGRVAVMGDKVSPGDLVRYDT